MLTPPTAALRIGKHLKTVEDQIDRTLIDHAQLTMTLGQARLDLAAHVGNTHTPLLRLAKAFEALLSARGEVARVHGELDRLAQERGDIPIDPKPSAILEIDQAEIAEAA